MSRYVDAIDAFGPAYTDIVPVHAKQVWTAVLQEWHGQAKCGNRGKEDQLIARSLPGDRELVCLMLCTGVAAVAQGSASSLPKNEAMVSQILAACSDDAIEQTLHLLSCNDSHLFEFCYQHLSLYMSDAQDIASPHAVFASLAATVMPEAADVVDYLVSADTMTASGHSFLEYFIAYLRLLSAKEEMRKVAVAGQWTDTTIPLIAKTQQMLVTAPSSAIPFNIAPVLLTVPDAFCIIEQGIYRSDPPQPQHFAFLKTKLLRTVLVLSAEPVSKAFLGFCDDARIRVVHMGAHAARQPHHGWKPVGEELIKEALEFALDARHHPMLVTCSSGIQETSIFVGCLRRLQQWNFNSIVFEYHAFAQHKVRYANEQFIELFDTDLVTLPSDDSLPTWLQPPPPLTQSPTAADDPEQEAQATA
ncbi:hypothetical protein RI367_002569 [Sorochytrium milnesiophthora]